MTIGKLCGKYFLLSTLAPWTIDDCERIASAGHACIHAKIYTSEMVTMSVYRLQMFE